MPGPRATRKLASGGLSKNAHLAEDGFPGPIEWPIAVVGNAPAVLTGEWSSGLSDAAKSVETMGLSMAEKAGAAGRAKVGFFHVVRRSAQDLVCAC